MSISGSTALKHNFEEQLAFTNALKKAALSEEAKAYLLQHPTLYNLLYKAATRFVTGQTLRECLAKAEQINRSLLMAVTVDFMGENLRNKDQIISVVSEFLQIINQTRKGFRNSVSLDLSHIGLAISEEMALDNLSVITAQAKAQNCEVIISAEGVDRTDSVLRIYRSLADDFPNLGITLQAYLYRTSKDFKDVLKHPGRIRIVKGAFDAPKEIAMPRSSDLNEAYLSYVEELMATNHLCSIATHDTSIQKEAEEIIKEYKPTPDTYEFESLYGINTEQLSTLQKKGHPCRQYLVYGREWYLYLCNRLAEHPNNIFRAICEIVQG